MDVDFLGDKKGARLDYGSLFDLFDGETLETTREEYDIPRHYAVEDKAFIESYKSGVKNQAYIDNILESAKVLDALYESSEKKTEISY